MKSILMYLKLRSWVFKSELEYWLSISIVFSMSLVLAVAIFQKTLMMSFLVWNLFLAGIPYVISRAMQSRRDWHSARLLFFLCFSVWLLVIPNSFYIITDLFHLGKFNGIPLWYELAVILSFAWNGLILGIWSMRHMETLFSSLFSVKVSVPFIYIVMFLNSFGVYIGRYMRFNSWDVITNPFHLMKDIANLALHPRQNFGAWAMICCFSVFMTLMYFTVTRIHAKEGANIRE